MQIWTRTRATPHTASPQNGTEKASRNPVPRIQILRNMLFAKKHKKDLKKMQQTTQRPSVQTLRPLRPL